MPMMYKVIRVVIIAAIVAVGALGWAAMILAIMRYFPL